VKYLVCKKCQKKDAILRENLCQLCFLEEFKPTNTIDRSWLYVDNNDRLIEEDDNELDDEEFIKKFIEERKQYTIKDNTIEILHSNGTKEEYILNKDNIDKIAQKHSVLTGKWLIFEHEFDINYIWKKIAKATINNELGCSTKVSTAFQSSKTKRYVICVYTDNYLIIEDVMRVREKLQTLGFKKELTYKPDIYTLLGIYQGTTTLSPTRYRA